VRAPAFLVRLSSIAAFAILCGFSQLVIEFHCCFFGAHQSTPIPINYVRKPQLLSEHGPQQLIVQVHGGQRVLLHND
jgi:hypothetical protein